MAVPDQILTLARKMSSDPAIQRQIAESFFRLFTSNPALGRRLLDGDPQAVMEAYQTLIRNNGSVPMPSGPPLLGARPIGPGETVGGVTGPGVTVNPGTGLIPAAPRGLPHDPSATRQLTTTGGDAPDALDSAAREITVIDAAPGTGLITSDGGALVPSGGRGPGVRVGGVGGPPVPAVPRVRGKPSVIPPEAPPRGGVLGWALPAAAGAYGAAVGIGAYSSANRDGAVADDLDAAANPVTPDPEVGAPAPRTWRDMTDDEMVANLPEGNAPGGGAGVRQQAGQLPTAVQRAVAAAVEFDHAELQHVDGFGGAGRLRGAGQGPRPRVGATVGDAVDQAAPPGAGLQAGQGSDEQGHGDLHGSIRNHQGVDACRGGAVPR